jgi:transposase
VLTLPDAVRVFVAREAVDFRKAHDGLFQVVRGAFGDDPLSGHLFVFTNRRRDRIKLLFWDRNGLWLLYKRLERGTFPRFALAGDAAREEVDRSWLAMLLDGIEPRSARFHAHHVSRVSVESRHAHGRTSRPAGTHPRT